MACLVESSLDPRVTSPPCMCPIGISKKKADIDIASISYLSPKIKRKSGLRKDDLIEILLDSRALPKDSDPYIRGMLVGTSRNVIEILDENGDFRSIARDVIVELRLITHLRKPYIEDRELLTFEKEDMRRRSNLHEAAERQADGRDDNHVWD